MEGGSRARVGREDGNASGVNERSTAQRLGGVPGITADVGTALCELGYDVGYATGTAVPWDVVAIGSTLQAGAVSMMRGESVKSERSALHKDRSTQAGVVKADTSSPSESDT